MKPFLHGKASILAIVVLLLGMSSTALAAVKGDPLKVGVNNTINLLTGLSGSVRTTMFNVVNKNTTATASAIRAVNAGGGPALDLVVQAGRAPMKVSSNAKVINLNADLLDGLDSSALQRRLTGGCLAGSSISEIGEDGTVLCEPDNDSPNADFLDDLDSSAFQRRVSGVCAPGSSISAIGADGTVTCEASVSSGGDITGVAAGAGLTGGGDTGSPTLSANFTPSGGSNGAATTVARGDHNHNSLYLATTGKAADANLLDGVDSAAFQRRVTGACPTGQSISAIGANGAVTCELDNDSGGDITGVAAGSGLIGGGASGSPTLSANFTPSGGSNGTSTSVARGNHDHNLVYLQGRGQAVHGAHAIAQNSSTTFFSVANPDIALAYSCPSTRLLPGKLRISNSGKELVNIFYDDGTDEPWYQQVAAGAHWEFWTAPNEHITVQVQGTEVATIEVFSAHRDTDCHVQAQGLLTR